jgi:DNA helicase-2/ATP-dependent DNA helicase PcrA
MPDLTNLNPQQVNAVKHTNGPALVLAGPGSGKTRVLTHRIAYLIEQGIARPHEIMAITFTNKAAGEMKSRIKDLTNEFSPEWIGTFHSTCAKILRIDGKNIGIPSSFNIYDTDDSVALIKQIEQQMNIDPKKYHPINILGAISSAKQELIDEHEYKGYAQGVFQDIVSRVYVEYQKNLTRAESLDFSDLIFKTVKLFTESSETLHKYNERFKYILVDEYQDTNKAQYDLTKLLSKSHNNIFVVGDMAQAIYSWRGADYRNIINFKRDYPSTKVYNLEQNYRSTKVIIDASKGLISKNETNLDLDLWTDNDKGDLITLYSAYSEKDEADFIADQISKCNRPLNEIGILYRTNAQSRNIEDTFVKLGIPYRIIGGIKFYARKEVKDVISFLKVINNPKDTVAWQRIINIPPKGIGQKTFEKIRDGGFDLETIKAKTGIDYKKLAEDAKKLQTISVLEEILEETNYISYLESQNEENEKIEARKENIKELKSVAQEFENLQDFLENVALVEAESEDDDETTDKVTLMTLHSAKGLEFDVVFLVGLEEGLFPHSRSVEEKDKLEEERRLCYVGVTRARKKLYLTYATKRLYFGTTSFNTVSRFIAEIPEDLIETQNTSSHNEVSAKSIDDFFDEMGI